MGFFDFFVKDVETKDAHPKSELRTHYYKVEYRDAKEAVMRYLTNNHLNVKNVDDTFGEILVEESSYHLIISIKKLSVLETAIDFKVSFYGLFGANRPYKLVKEFYDYLDKEIRFSGIGLNA